MQNNESEIGSTFEECWENGDGNNLIENTLEVVRNLEKRLVELKCQEATMKEQLNETQVASSLADRLFSDRRLL